MAQLAIKGHATRGQEVIEILEMLGGKTHATLCGNLTFRYYYIKSDGFIDYKYHSTSDDIILYSLEEFLEKFPYKVEDKVLLSGVSKIIKQARWDDVNNEVIYKLETNVRGFLEEYYVHYYELQPYKEETMGRNYDVEKYLQVWKETEKGLEVVVNDRFELKEDNGKFYIIKKRPQYPKTYEECAKVLLERASVRNDIGYKGDLIVTLQKLLVCRDAYWKIAGDQMGLGKPWEPRCDDGYQRKWIIFCQNGINFTNCFKGHFVLAFPTPEIRDTFYENFKDLIEQCKELL